MRCDRPSHVFPSPRPGVAALRLPGAVSEKEKRARSKILSARDLRYREAFLRDQDGQVHALLLESKHDAGGRPQALTDTYVRVAVETGEPAGSWVRARLRWTGDPRRMLGEAGGPAGAAA
jgi:tRNA A37 methylthiotransferase MiaB